MIFLIFDRRPSIESPSKLLFYDFSRKSGSMGRDRTAWIDHRIGSKTHKITNDGSQFSSARIYQSSFREGMDTRIIMSPVRGYHSRSKIHIIPSNGINDHSSLRNHGVIPKITTLNF